MRRIVILTRPLEAAHLPKFVRTRHAGVAVEAAVNETELLTFVGEAPEETRLIAFCTGVIVPADILAALGPVPYNIHPGPPEYPGVHPESLAIWEGAETFGATAHEMHAAVDAGPIVAVDRFDMPPRPERTALADRAYPVALNLFAMVADWCAMTDAAMPEARHAAWGPRKMTMRKYRAFKAEIAARRDFDRARFLRAFGREALAEATRVEASGEKADLAQALA